MDITVIIATRNRAASLRETLEDLAKQETGGAFVYEVIVADNGSTDETAKVVEASQKKISMALRYVYEAQPGKAFALNTAIAQARNPLIAFTDDDCRMEKNWLALIVKTFEDQKADGVGGPSKPLIVGKQPDWLSDRLVKQLGYIDYGQKNFVVQDYVKHVFIGTNHAYRRELFQRLGGFDVNRIGNSEDVEFFQRVAKAGGKLVYVPGISVLHKLEAERWTPKAMAARFFRQGRAASLGIQEKGGYRGLCRVPLWAVRYYIELHFEALICLLSGKKDEALWHWFRRHIYGGMIAGTFSDWLHKRPLIRPRPEIAK
jgi:glucosyl-dolichyl phosphate glucuronosyltransferase